MNTVTKKTKIDADGWLKVQAPAELENQEVDVIIVPRRPPAAERVAAWQDLGEKAQNLPDSKAITEEEIQREVDDYRAGTMNLLVDTNVVISALIRDGIPRRVVNEVVARDNWFWIVTQEIETEYHAVLARPRFKIPSAIQQDFKVFIETVTIRVRPVQPPPFPRDPKDELFIAAALASDADFLITGDKDLLEEQPLASTQIVRPAEFARLFAII